jgi:hypothetical protein
MFVWAAFVFSIFKKFAFGYQVLYYFCLACSGLLFAWLSILSHREILVLTIVLLNVALLITNTAKGILNRKQ